MSLEYILRTMEFMSLKLFSVDVIDFVAHGSPGNRGRQAHFLLIANLIWLACNNCP